MNKKYVLLILISFFLNINCKSQQSEIIKYSNQMWLLVEETKDHKDQKAIIYYPDSNKFYPYTIFNDFNSAKFSPNGLEIITRDFNKTEVAYINRGVVWQKRSDPITNYLYIKDSIVLYQDGDKVLNYNYLTNISTTFNTFTTLPLSIFYDDSLKKCLSVL